MYFLKYILGILCGLCTGALDHLSGSLEFQVPDKLLELIFLCSDCGLDGKIRLPFTTSDQCHQVPATFLAEKGEAEDDPGSEATESTLLHLLAAISHLVGFPSKFLFPLGVSSGSDNLCCSCTLQHLPKPASKLCGPFEGKLSTWT